jgi:murein DD-endopeptidase MepM/ murein hydrolase activator NlpD
VDKKYFIGATVLLLVSLGMIFGLSRINDGSEPESPEEIELLPEVLPITYQYGIVIDSFRMEESVVSRNQNLSTILLERGISYSQIDELARKSKSIFDVRKIKAGKNCVFFWSQDSASVLKYLVYEKNLEEYIVYSFGDSVQVFAGQKDISLENRHVSGTINSSPWNAMVDLGVSTKLAIELEEIYAWTINFFRIQKGDEFSIVYTVRMLEGQAIGVNEVLACSFKRGQQDNYAFRFQQNNIFSYYDEQGQSLRRAFRKAPLRSYSRISSKFSKSRFHPVLRVYRPHSGVDYAAPTGTAIIAIGDGRVVKKGRDKAAGNYLRIEHNSVYQSGYNHMSSFGKGIKVGAYVKQGQEIGYVGSTGYATGPHLDFRMYKNGQAVDPLKIKSPPVEPVLDSLRSEFDMTATEYIRQLENLEPDSQI